MEKLEKVDELVVQVWRVADALKGAKGNLAVTSK